MASGSGETHPELGLGLFLGKRERDSPERAPSGGGVKDGNGAWKRGGGVQTRTGKV